MIALFRRRRVTVLVAGVALSAGGVRAEGLEADRLNYGDLLQVGGATPDPGTSARREMRALTHLWKRLPRRSSAARAMPRAPLTVEGQGGGGAALIRQSGAFVPGTGGTADYEDATGANIDLYGSISGDPLRRGAVTLGGELEVGARIQPVSGGALLTLRAPVLVPVRIDLPVPLVVAPLAVISQVSSSTQSLLRFQPGITAGMFWSGRLGLSGVRGSVMGSSYRARAMVTSVVGVTQEQTLTSEGGARFSATLGALQLAPLANPKYRLKFSATLGIDHEDLIGLDEGMLTARPWRWVQGEARAGAEADLTRGVALGLELLGGLGLNGSPEGYVNRQSGLGLASWLGVTSQHVDVSLTASLKRLDTTAFEGETGVFDAGVLANYQLQASWGIFAGGRF